MQERFSISHKGQELGPFSKDEILRKVKANELSALDFVFVEGRNDWVPLLEAFPVAATARPPETRPPGGPDAAKHAPPAKPQAPMKAPPMGGQMAQKPQAPPRMAPPQQAAKPQAPPLMRAKPAAAPTQPPPIAAATPPPIQAAVPQKAPPIAQSTTQASPMQPVAVAPPIAAQPVAAEATNPVVEEAVPQVAAAQPVASQPQQAAPALHLVHSEDSAPKAQSQPQQHQSAAQEIKVEAKKGTISLKGGIGTLELLQYTAGTVRLALLDEKNLGLSLGKPEELVVKAAPAAKLVLKGPAELTAGQGAAVTIEAQDKWGNRDSGFSGSVTATLSNGTAVGEVKLAGGRGTIHFTSTKAETVTVKLTDSARTGLDVSCTWQVQYVAGPAARLVIVTPDETVAGQPVKVEVKALDQFGNLATACNDAIHLEVTTAVKAPTSNAKRQAS